MNEQDKQTFYAAWEGEHSGEEDAQRRAMFWFEKGLEYARSQQEPVQQEPVAWINYSPTDGSKWYSDMQENIDSEPLYTTPPAQPVQPAGEQGDAVHFRAVLCSEQQNRAVGVVPKVVGFVDRKAAEQFILEKRDFQGWKYNLEPLYTTPPTQQVQPAGAQGEADDSLLLCASDLEHSAIYDNQAEMQECIRAVAQRIKALGQPSPTATINEQLLEQLQRMVDFVTTGLEVKEDHPYVEMAKTAIRAAEAAKVGV